MAGNYMIGDEILVSPTSPKMYGKYKIIGVADYEITGGLLVREVSDQPTKVATRVGALPTHSATLTVTEHVNLTTNLFTKQAGRLDSATKLTIRPKRSMFGLYEIIEPPDMFAKIYPSQDTFIREDRPRVSYGKEQSVIFGNYFGNQYKTLIQYDVAAFSTKGSILNAKIVFNTDSALENFDASIYKVTREWSETDTTWMNAPGEGELITTFKAGGLGRFEVDITEQFLDWYNGAENYGIYITKNEPNKVGTRSYGSRESAFSHYIEVCYKDPFVYSFNNLHNRWGLTVRPYTDFKGSVEVKPVEFYTEVGNSLHVVDPSSMPSLIDVNTPNILSEIDVKYSRSGTWGSTIVIPQTEMREQFTSLRVKVDDISKLDSKLNVTLQVDMLTGMAIAPIGYLNSSIGIRTYSWSDSLTTIGVSQFEDLPTSLYIHDYIDDRGKLTVSRSAELEGKTQLIITEFNDLVSSILPKLKAAEQLPHSLFVNSPWVDGIITVRQYNNVNVPGKFITRVNGETALNGTILPRVTRHQQIRSQLGVRVAATHNMPSYFIVRAWDAVDLFMLLRIEGGSANVDYVFIM